MVKHAAIALAIVALAASPADARHPWDMGHDPAPSTIAATPVPSEGTPEPASEPEGHNKLGFRLALGRLPLEMTSPFTFTLGLGLEHAIFRRWRAIAEYEWMWLMERERDGNRELTFVGHGHRLHAGLRRALMDRRALHDLVKLYIDVELGGGIGIASGPADVVVLPHGFFGLRAGYRFASDHARSSKSLEAELHLRAIATEHGVGLAFGVGWMWGD